MFLPGFASYSLLPEGIIPYCRRYIIYTKSSFETSILRELQAFRWSRGWIHHSAAIMTSGNKRDKSRRGKRWASFVCGNVGVGHRGRRFTLVACQASQPASRRKGSHHLSLSARTLKMIASQVTWSAWEAAFKGWSEREWGRERKHHRMWKKKGREGKDNYYERSGNGCLKGIADLFFRFLYPTTVCKFLSGKMLLLKGSACVTLSKLLKDSFVNWSK